MYQQILIVIIQAEQARVAPVIFSESRIIGWNIPEKRNQL